MRAYIFDVSRPGVQLASNREATSPLCLRAVVPLLFRKWFGSWPDARWGVDGFMGEASDRRGNRVQVTQYNHGHPMHPKLMLPWGVAR